MNTTGQYTGLTSAQVEENRRKYGSNLLTPPKKTAWWKAYLKKFTDPLIVVLLVAGVLSIGVSYYEYATDPDAGFGVFFEPIGIFIAIFLATTLSFAFEYRAEKEFNILNKVNDEEPVTVVREGNTVQIPKRDVVYGDIVVLSTGEEVPADGVLLEAMTLGVDESTLTGEPMAHKTTEESEFDPDATYPSNHVLRGTKVMEGHGVMQVTAVGDMTENGKVMVQAGIADDGETPLNEQMRQLGKYITWFAYGAAVLVILGRLLMFFLNNPDSFTWLGFITYMLHTCMIAVALIVVSVPEGLPMAVTLSLAYSMRRMLKNNNLVRKLHACETMGATTVICTDKTGTLTQNQMRMNASDFFCTESEMPFVDEGIAVNSTATLDTTNPDHPAALGNPTEGALLLWLASRGIDYRQLREQAPKLDELPFTTERKYMASVVTSAVSGRRMLYVKGAPEIVMGLCSRIAGDHSRQSITDKLLQYQSQAMRTLGFAMMEIPEGAEWPIQEGHVKTDGLVFLGIVAISDPVRPDVAAAVQDCINAGINIKIVTGDTPATAIEIGRQIGLWTDADGDENIITGAELAKLTDDELLNRVLKLKIIARARPMDKKRLVEALRKLRQVVAVTGDGTNDAPALKAADVGLSMGDGTSVAKEASDITIIDNSFTSIGKAVMWGRSLYRNIQRFILFQLTVNVVACFTVLLGSFLGTDSPLTVTQMLWVNLIMDTFAAVALATLPPSPQVMTESPRSRGESIITKRMLWFIVPMGILMTAILFCLLWFMQHTGESYCLSQLLSFTPNNGGASNLTGYEQTFFFTTFVMFQFWNLFNAKAFHTNRSPFHFAHCTEFLLIIGIIFIGQIAIVRFGGDFFNVVPLSLLDWVIIVVATGIISLIIGEIIRKFSNWLREKQTRDMKK